MGFRLCALLEWSYLRQIYILVLWVLTNANEIFVLSTPWDINWAANFVIRRRPIISPLADFRPAFDWLEQGSRRRVSAGRRRRPRRARRRSAPSRRASCSAPFPGVPRAGTTPSRPRRSLRWAGPSTRSQTPGKLNCPLTNFTPDFPQHFTCTYVQGASENWTNQVHEKLARPVYHFPTSHVRIHTLRMPVTVPSHRFWTSKRSLGCPKVAVPFQVEYWVYLARF